MDAGQGRVYIDQNRNLSSSDVICNRTSPETGSEFHVIIKEGMSIR